MDEIKELIEKIKADTNPVHASRAAHALLQSKLGEALEEFGRLRHKIEGLLHLNEHLANSVGENVDHEAVGKATALKGDQV